MDEETSSYDPNYDWSQWDAAADEYVNSYVPPLDTVNGGDGGGTTRHRSRAGGELPPVRRPSGPNAAMSKYVKNLLVDDLKGRLRDINDVIVVSLGRLDGTKTTTLRQALRKKKINLHLIKNSLARRATLDTPLAPAFTKTEGMLAIAWGEIGRAHV